MCMLCGDISQTPREINLLVHLFTLSPMLGIVMWQARMLWKTVKEFATTPFKRQVASIHSEPEK